MVFGRVFNEYITFKVTFFINSLSLEYYTDVHKAVFWINKLALVHTNKNIYYFNLPSISKIFWIQFRVKKILALMFLLAVVIYYMFCDMNKYYT